MTTTVINLRDQAAVQAAKETGTFVYIGRAMPRQRLAGSPFANPFKVGPDGDRDQVIARYREWILTQEHLLDDLGDLCGKTLACWCAPQACHGDVLSELADESRRWPYPMRPDHVPDLPRRRTGPLTITAPGLTAEERADMRGHTIPTNNRSAALGAATE